MQQDPYKGKRKKKKKAKKIEKLELHNRFAEDGKNKRHVGSEATLFCQSLKQALSALEPFHTFLNLPSPLILVRKSQNPQL